MPLGRVVATERRPNTPHEFHFWTAIDSPVGIGTIVRVEIAASHASPEKADEISRWILAEAAPLSLPDSRWDTMVYGIRDCEETLRAV